MKRVLRYSVIVVCIVTVILLLMLFLFKYLFGSKAVYDNVVLEQLNKSVIYRVESIDEGDGGYVVCFEDINEEAPTLNATYKSVPNEMKEGVTFRANWLRVTAKMWAVQAYKDLIAMDYTGYELTDETIERIKIETVDALALVQKEHYKPHMRVLITILCSIETFVVIFCVLVVIHEYLDMQEDRRK